ncbi:alpha-amylase family glycosyl hydrolase [Fulvivirga lutea]|uniref:Alpha-amylase n=1 Tax=Fulvivirga lutea TaxID=2810512 RepID=A0A974WFN7_9BACT|nr:alpha-amylase family glycosyl hydrolase [Fulvivirga lutea]QSE97125.1 alpha-amylase [Fulvivirga lutea]
MKRILGLIIITTFCCITSCDYSKQNQESSQQLSDEAESSKFDWNTASIYFLLTDRFNNGDSTNDINFNRTKETSKLRDFMGGDVKGITEKIKDGYFTNLGIDAIWFSPVFEQIRGYVDEGSGVTYGFHGYWPKDWSALEPNFGTKEDIKEMVAAAHEKGIRVLMDVIINHTGPVTDKDPVWPADWVRTEPQCTYQSYETTVSCTLVKNLPDVLTDSEEEVEIPLQLAEKWRNEGRYEQEVAELDAFFNATGFPRYPKYYIIKWLIDLIKDYGIDGFRVDTVKHVEEDVFDELANLAQKAFEDWKKANSDAVLDDEEFFMLGEVYNYGISGKQQFNFGDSVVNYFDNGFQSLINFEFVWDCKQMEYEALFSKYDSILATEEMKNIGILNYIDSHDDGNPYDGAREKPYESANKLLLTPGGAQIYYGDETARSLVIEGTEGDATLRSFMNWDDLKQAETKAILTHWQKLGKFRQMHPAISRGEHAMLNESPYTFSRKLGSDNVVIALEAQPGEKTIHVGGVFENGQEVTDYYSNKKAIVTDGSVTIASDYNTVLLQL